MPENYSGQNLRGRSFKNKDLTGVNFSDADIRGANFTNAILVNANFSNAKAGLQEHWRIVSVIIVLLLAALLGFLLGIGSYFVIHFFLPSSIKVLNSYSWYISLNSACCLIFCCHQQRLWG